MQDTLIEFVQKVSRMRSAEKINEMIAEETDVDRASILSHRLAQLQNA